MVDRLKSIVGPLLILAVLSYAGQLLYLVAAARGLASRSWLAWAEVISETAAVVVSPPALAVGGLLLLAGWSGAAPTVARVVAWATLIMMTVATLVVVFWPTWGLLARQKMDISHYYLPLSVGVGLICWKVATARNSSVLPEESLAADSNLPPDQLPQTPQPPPPSPAGAAWGTAADAAAGRPGSWAASGSGWEPAPQAGVTPAEPQGQDGSPLAEQNRYPDPGER